MIVTEVEQGGMPRPMNQKRRLRTLVGLIARQRLSLVMPGFRSLSRRDKWSLFDNFVHPHLEFQGEI